MRLTLNRMKLENFKGVRNLEVVPNGYDVRISGANGTGKTTLVDAFCWVLFNQNANGDAPGSDTFREKPLDDHGQPVHNVDTLVELCCTLDGQRFDMKRRQTENWVKKRGSAEATFQGNVSTYWINGVEVKQSEFKQRVMAIADGDVFRLVGSLGAFNRMDWKKRRQMLLDIAGTDVNGRLLAMDEYRPLADEIADQGVSIDDLRKVLADRRKGINTELKMLPVRIDEAKKSMPTLTDREIRDAEYMVKSCRTDLESIDAQIADAKAASGEANDRNRKLALQQEILSIKRRIMDDYDAQKRRLEQDARVALDTFTRYSAQLADAKRRFNSLSAELGKVTETRDVLRVRYKERQRCEETVDTTCPTCGQPLPEEKIEEAKIRLKESRRRDLDEIQQQGKRAAQQVISTQTSLDKAQDDIRDLEGKVKRAETALESANAVVRGFAAEQPDFNDSRLLEAEKELSALNSNTGYDADEKVRLLVERKAEIQALIDSNLSLLARRDAGKETEQRIRSYEAQQVEMGAKLAETETMIILLERFIQERCEALESSINDHFPTVRWKLFDTQINGGIVDTCVALLDCDGTPVPYESANTASQIAADMEIVDALSRHYDIRVPLFIDNAERVNILPEIESQTITLSVGTESELTIITNNKKEAA